MLSSPSPQPVNSSPARGGGPFAQRRVVGHVQGITTPESQEDSPVPLHHPADGPPPHSGEDLRCNSSPARGGGARVASDGGGSLLATSHEADSPLHPQPAAGGLPPYSGEDLRGNSSPERGGGARVARDGGGSPLATSHEADSPLHPQPAAGGPPPYFGEDSVLGPARNDWPKASSPRWRGFRPPTTARHPPTLAPRSRGQSSPATAPPAG